MTEDAINDITSSTETQHATTKEADAVQMIKQIEPSSSNISSKGNTEKGHSASVPLSPSYDNVGRHFNQQGYYYSQNSPGTPLRQPVSFMRQTYPSIPPLSPSDGNQIPFDESVIGGIPPASPLFPGALPLSRLPNSPGMQYLTAQHPNSPLISYGGVMMQGSPEHSSWMEGSMQQHDIYTPAPSPYVASAVYPPDMNPRRTTSFDNGEFLPSPALDDTQGIYAASSFAQQQWAYSAPNIPFGNPQSSFQPNLQLRSPPRMQGGRVRGQPPPAYYPATASPGPPIQTTNTNKGPDGSNLFVFHIPNHFTNIDMYNLFCIYGNLLSVRIMVEKESGRSRGFGFVSYDNPESAALAIKNLNGFVVGTKRLKVQHKQIVKGSSGYPETGYGDMYATSQGDENNVDPSEISSGYGSNVPGIDGTLGADYFKEGNTPTSHEGILSNLEDIGEALPDVSA